MPRKVDGCHIHIPKHGALSAVDTRVTNFPAGGGSNPPGGTREYDGVAGAAPFLVSGGRRQIRAVDARVTNRVIRIGAGNSVLSLMQVSSILRRRQP